MIINNKKIEKNPVYTKNRCSINGPKNEVCHEIKFLVLKKEKN